MAVQERTYTYRAGKRVELEKRSDQFVIRARAEQLRDLGITHAEKVSSIASRVTVPATDLEPVMGQARRIAPTHHAYYRGDTGEEFLITDRIFVTFRRPMSAAELAEFAGRYGLLLLERYSDRAYLFQLTDHTGMNPVKLVVKLTEEDADVEQAEHDLNRRATIHQLVPTDPSYVRQWHLHERLSDPEFDRRASSRCEGAWLLLDNLGSPDVVVGVTDDGCRLDHVDFDTPGKFAGWGYFEGTRLITHADVEADPARMYQAGANHGTSCAGVVAAEVDAVLTVGAAPGSRLLPIKWESSGPFLLISDSKLLRVLDWIADKVDVLSNSWGNAPTSVWVPLVIDRITRLAQTGGRRGRGIVFLWAAGNENCPIQHQASIDVPYTDGWEVRPDGSAVWVGVETARRFENNLVGIPGVMHVAALASTARRSHYSNYGTGITICAPTSNSHAYHRLPVPGLRITTTTGATGSVTGSFGGTSSATPLVAGVAALVIAANSELTALEVVSVLKRTASKDLSLQGYSRTPSASFDPDTAWDVSPIAPFARGDFADVADPDGQWSPWFGHGRVDAQAAVAAAQGLHRPPAPTLRYASSPRIQIPDRDATGIRDVIRVAERGRVRSARVRVDIAHSWIGDLRVRVIAPDGASAVLHDRTGGSQDDIQRSYDAAAVPPLASLAGRETAGDWTLHVQDLAAADVGTLLGWSLEIEAAPEPVVAEDSEPVRIPDADPIGIARKLDLPDVTVESLAISVDISHTWIGDLRITITPPGGHPIVLHDQSGGDADNLVRTWRSDDIAGLRALRGQSARGTWQLDVADVAREDEGKLNGWRIEVAV